MITFNLQVAHNGNWFAGYKPGCDGPWDRDQNGALVLTIEQARELVTALRGCGLRIEIAVSMAEPITGDHFRRELFCAGGGSWYDYKPGGEPITICPRCSAGPQECVAYTQFNGWTLCTHEQLMEICNRYGKKCKE